MSPDATVADDFGGSHKGDRERAQVIACARRS
jgi:hypothetical protein